MSETNGQSNNNLNFQKRARRSYTDRDKAAALAALDINGGNESETARQLGIPRITLHEWAEGRVNRDVSEFRREKKAELAEILEELALNLAEKMLRSDRASGVDLGIVIDKLLLLRGEPNAISKEVTHTSPERRRERILELVEKAKVT